MSVSIRRALAALAFFILPFAVERPAEAVCLGTCSCTVTVNPLAFGTFTPAASSPVKVSGSGNIACTGTLGLGVTVMATLSAGSGTIVQRTMAGPGAFVLKYNVYTDMANTMIFGDGTSGSSTLTYNLTLLAGTTNQPISFYGAIPVQSTAGPSGTYTDSPLMTISF